MVVEYLTNLKIVILSSFRPSRLHFVDDDSLMGLFEGDTGDASPNFSNHYIFGRYVNNNNVI